MINGKNVSAVINCAGQGTRFGGNKLLVEIDGMTVIERSVRAFLGGVVDEVVVTVSEEAEAAYRRVLLEQAALDVTLVRGGAQRHVSALNGLLGSIGELVVVHDGARPFVTRESIERTLYGADSHGAAMLGTPSLVQVKLVNRAGFVEGSLDRAHSWLGQTPQAFRRDLLLRAYESAVADGYERVSDDADLVAEYTGIQAVILEGPPENIKITTPQDVGTAWHIAVGWKALD
jgi:2-C-methyl-D-erythritol 4-phosphate cytidylyltransferase